MSSTTTPVVCPLTEWLNGGAVNVSQRREGKRDHVLEKSFVEDHRLVSL